MGNGQEPSKGPTEPGSGSSGSGSSGTGASSKKPTGGVTPDDAGDQPPQERPLIRAARTGGAMGGFIGGLIGALIGACLCGLLHR